MLGSISEDAPYILSPSLGQPCTAFKPQLSAVHEQDSPVVSVQMRGRTRALCTACHSELLVIECCGGSKQIHKGEKASGENFRIFVPELIFNDVSMQHRGHAFVLRRAIRLVHLLCTPDEHRPFPEARGNIVIIDPELVEEHLVLEIRQRSLQNGLCLSWRLSSLLSQCPVARIVLVVYMGVHLRMPVLIHVTQVCHFNSQFGCHTCRQDK